MSEIRRVYRKKSVCFLVVLCVINFALFLFSAAPDKEITLTGDRLTDYITSYPGFLARTAESGRTLATLSMYRKGYAYEVLRKSTAAYESLEGVSPRGGDNRGIVLFLQYRITDLFLLAFLIIQAADFLAERKKGLAGMVRSTLKGRGNLYLQRVSTLAFSAVFGAVLLYGGNYLGLLFTFGKTDLSRCIQSLPEYMKCPYHLTIGGYLAAFVLVKAIGCFVAASIFFLLISLLGTTSAYVGMGLLVVAEVLLHQLVLPVSSVNILRYLNLYTVITCEEFFTDYCFINLFGKAVPALTGCLVFQAVIIVALAVAGLIIHGKMYVTNKQLGERLANKIAKTAEKYALQRTLIGWEAYKLFFKQGGILIGVAVFILHLFLSTRYPYSYPVGAYEQLMYLKYEGVITEQVVADAELELELLDSKIKRYERMRNELMLEDPIDTYKLNGIGMALSEAQGMREGLLPVVENIRDGMEYTRKTGHTVNVVQPYFYDMLLRRDEKTRDRASLFILIGIIGAVSGVFAFDAENQMRDSIHTAYRGRLQTNAIKLFLVFVICAVICTAVHLIQMLQIGSDLGFHNLDAPIQSLPFMRTFGIYVSILGYLVLLFAVRAAVAYGIGLLCSLVSRFSRDTVTALGICAFLFVVPTVFAQMIPGGEKFSAIYLLGASYFKGGEIREAEVEEAAAEWVYVPEYRELSMPDSVYALKLSGDYLYYPENEKILCKYSLLDGSIEKKELDYSEDGNLNYFDVTQDGSIYAVYWSWHEKSEAQDEEAQEDEKKQQDEAQEDEALEGWSSQELIKFDAQGREIYRVDLQELFAEEGVEYIERITADDKGRVYMVSNNVILLLDAQGSYHGKINVGGKWGTRISALGQGADGKMYATYGSFSYSCVEIDFDLKKTGTVYGEVPGVGNLSSGVGKDLLMYDSTAVYEYDLEEQAGEELFQWLDSDIDGTIVWALGATSDGRIAAVTRDHWNENAKETALVLLTKKHSSEVQQKETIVLATMSSSQELKTAAVKFNRANDRYRISIKEYWNYSSRTYSNGNWTDSRTRLNNDLLSDKCPDIIDLSGMDAANLAAQGMILDLNPYLEGSSVLQRENFVENVLACDTYDGVLAGIPKRFMVQTIVGRTSDVGADMGWQQKDMVALADAHPGAEILDYASKWTVLHHSLMYSENAFVDWESGKCSFDTPEFIELLKFANRFSENINYNDDISQPARIQNGDVLLSDATISDLRDVQLYRASFGGDITFIGYPTIDGDPGCAMIVNNSYGLVAKSQKKEAAWEFLEYYLSAEDDDRWAYGFPSDKRQLEKMIEEAVKVEYLKDDDGELVLDDDGNPIEAGFHGSVSYWDGWSYTYHASTREEADQVLALIAAAKPEQGLNGDIYSIISEEAGYFFKGAKSAEAAAQIIQKRVQLYVNENR